MNKPIEIDGVKIVTGDYLVADADGIVIIPKNLTNEVEIETDVEIQDISVSLEKRYKNKDVHFQNLNEFEMKEFIREEIYLNIPNITFCEDKDCNHENINKKADLTKPFKKIRDLIK